MDLLCVQVHLNKGNFNKIEEDVLITSKNILMSCIYLAVIICLYVMKESLN